MEIKKLLAVLQEICQQIKDSQDIIDQMMDRIDKFIKV